MTARFIQPPALASAASLASGHSHSDGHSHDHSQPAHSHDHGAQEHGHTHELMEHPGQSPTSFSLPRVRGRAPVHEGCLRRAGRRKWGS